MKNKLKIIFTLLFSIIILACSPNSNSAKGTVIGFLDSVKTFQVSPEKFYSYLNIPSDDDIQARISGLKAQTKEEFIFYPVFVNQIKYEIKEDKTVEKGNEITVEVKNVSSRSVLPKLTKNFINSGLDPETSASLSKEERDTKVKKVVKDTIDSFTDEDYVSTIYIFHVLKADDGKYKIDLMGDVANLDERNRLLNELFNVLTPGLSEKPVKDNAADNAQVKELEELEKTQGR